MLHDYGFYKFEKFENYVDGNEKVEKDKVEPKEHLKPLFQTRD